MYDFNSLIKEKHLEKMFSWPVPTIFDAIEVFIAFFLDEKYFSFVDFSLSIFLEATLSYCTFCNFANCNLQFGVSVVVVSQRFKLFVWNNL